jgi:hypothetical protein
MPPPPESPNPAARLPLLLLGFLAAATLFLRTWGLDYEAVHPDDPKQIEAVVGFLAGDYTSYPVYHKHRQVRGYPYFAMHLVEWGYRGGEALMGHAAPTVAPPRTALPPKEFRDFLRRFALGLNVLYELAGLALVYLVGRRLFDPWAGIAAAAVFTVSSLHIQTAHFVGADLPQALFVLGVFFFSARLRDRERLTDWVGAGVCAGLAAATKYNGLLSLVAPALVFAELRLREGWRSALLPRRWAGPLAVLAAFATAFALATPLLLRPHDALAAIRSNMRMSATFHVPPPWTLAGRLRFVAEIWYHPLDVLLRFFEPLPGWLVLASVGVFVARRRWRESFLWIYPLVLFPVGVLGFPAGEGYHHLGTLTPLIWVLGSVAADGLRALRRPTLQLAAAAAVGGWALLAAASDCSMFTLPSAWTLTERWFRECAEPGRFVLTPPRDAPEDLYPRIFGLDLARWFAPGRAEIAQEAAERRAAVARFDMEKRVPTLNHIRNRPHRIHWRRRVERDVDLFPPPRRIGGRDEDVIFPWNLTFSRSPALLEVRPGEDAVRHIRRVAGESSWLLYAHYPARAGGPAEAALRVSFPGRRLTLRVGRGGDLLAELDLRRADLLYNGLFSTVRVAGDEPVVVWLVSPEERGWFLLQMERWQDLADWEAARPGWKDQARLAVARRHLGSGIAPEGLASRLAAAIPGYDTPGASRRYREWTRGVDTGLFADPRPAVPLERFSLAGSGGTAGFLPSCELPPGARVAGPREQLPPGFYRVVWEVSGTGGEGTLDFQVTAEGGSRQLARLSTALPAGRQTVSLPLRITAAAPGWGLDVPVLNRGDATVRLEGVRLENDPQRQLGWWLRELAQAVEGQRPDRAP